MHEGPERFERSEERPMAGHRSYAALALVFGSVAPVFFVSLFLWRLLGAPVSPWEFLLLLAGAFTAVAGPYVVGWERSFVAIVLALVTIRMFPVWFASWPGVVVAVSIIVTVAAIGALAWWSLRLGFVRKPRDAMAWRDPRHDTYPYPYA